MEHHSWKTYYLLIIGPCLPFPQQVVQVPPGFGTAPHVRAFGGWQVLGRVQTFGCRLDWEGESFKDLKFNRIEYVSIETSTHIGDKSDFWANPCGGMFTFETCVWNQLFTTMPKINGWCSLAATTVVPRPKGLKCWSMPTAQSKNDVLGIFWKDCFKGTINVDNPI